MARPRSKNDEIATAADRSPKSPRPATVINGDIARRAYDIYLSRDCEHGHDVEDWLQAERELQALSTAA